MFGRDRRRIHKPILTVISRVAFPRKWSALLKLWTVRRLFSSSIFSGCNRAIFGLVDRQLIWPGQAFRKRAATEDDQTSSDLAKRSVVFSEPRGKRKIAAPFSDQAAFINVVHRDQIAHFSAVPVIVQYHQKARSAIRLAMFVFGVFGWIARVGDAPSPPARGNCGNATVPWNFNDSTVPMTAPHVMSGFFSY